MDSFLNCKDKFYLMLNIQKCAIYIIKFISQIKQCSKSRGIVSSRVRNRRSFQGIVILLFLFACDGNAQLKMYDVSKQDFGRTVEFRTGVVGSISVPLDLLQDAKISSVNGLVFLFKDGTNFSMETITDKKIGFPGVNMNVWPEYLFGLKTKGEEPIKLVEDLIKSKSSLIDEEIRPMEIRKFVIEGGVGYWAIGKESSVVVLTSERVVDQITVFFTKRMKEESIVKTIINGVIK